MLLFKNKFVLVFCFALAFFVRVSAQLGFCGGNSGDPIYKEDFSSGKSDSKLYSGRTTYSYTQGPPKDGYYKVSSNTNYYGWFVTKDHTPNDKNGRCLIVNASYGKGEFFTLPVSGLCENTTYEFSSWLINLFPAQNKVCGPFGNESANPINITFEIWDSTGTTLLKRGDTGDIFSSFRANWQQYGLVFQTKPGQTSVILKMRNNGIGGCGNDLAIDDIMFRTCGDNVTIQDILKNKKNVFVEENELPFFTKLTAIPDLSVFSTHFYQWQKSDDGKNWVNIPKATNNSFSVKNVNEVTYYRALIAEAAVNLLNTSCNVISEVYKVNITASKIPEKQVLRDKPPLPKKQPKVQKQVVKIDTIATKTLKADSVQIEKLKAPKIEKKATITSLKPGVKTRKQVIIVKNGHHIIQYKVWIDGVVGKFVQTSENIIKQGDEGAGVIIEETLYYKAAYGYNCKKRTYTTEGYP